MNKQTLALLQEAKAETHSKYLRHKLARAIYQATFPRIGKHRTLRANYSKRWYRNTNTPQLEQFIHNEQWNLQVRRGYVAQAMRGQRNQTVAEVRECLAREELHYHKLTKELWRRQTIKFRWASASEAGRKVFIGNRLLSTETSS